ncbi:MAG: DUF3572 domain-containing protein [Rhodobacteraceae bacterium]|mgnify:CR=1 FL=1|jgi:2-hydroxychromene-2-carboxylate isomerase|nr:DUF3572 domain-containing protein [Paracoccaceae bacterium]
MFEQESAQILAIRALAFLAADDDLLLPFLAQTGLDPEELRARAEDPHLLAAVVDFLLSEDSRVLAFAAEAGIRPEAVLALRAALPGGDAPHWT